ncbi:hypothetical protein CN513_31410 [Bacillus cereus]|uniref:hypothetical protein n=1 Tax=Bacillus cereus TaxID=1396 RepID=UPI000BF74F9C|nr:hypothetical protein [Bacillus cereus]PET03960.1 hypothetical protein CN513_31410 [Bacillus cereus]
MGSTGTGRFGDYKKGTTDTKGLCEKELKNVELEEVGRLEYFNTYENVPAVGELVVISDSLENGRIVVVIERTGEKVGLFPTRYSYIPACIKQGFRYAGSVVYSTLKPFPKVVVDLNVE